MDGMRNGDQNILSSQVYEQGYIVSPIQMDMNMHMLGAMHAVSDKVTLMAMISYLKNDLNLRAMIPKGMSRNFSIISSGFEDIKLSALYQILNQNQQEFQGIVGVSLPTGAINENDTNPMSAPNEVILPYPMQIGSGTVDGILGLTYLGQNACISWGNQFKTTLRFGDNQNKYRLGNSYSLNNWFAFKAADWLSFSARVEGKIIGKIRGNNPDLNPMMVTTADPDNSGGKFVNSAIGFNTLIPGGSLRDVRLAFEFGYPLYQNLNGLQLKHKENITIGLQYAF